MAEIEITKYFAKMNRLSYDAFLDSMRHAKGERNRNLDLAHLVFYLLSARNGDIAVTLAALDLDRGRALKDIDATLSKMDKNVTETPDISENLGTTLEHAWTYATLLFGEVQIRSGHILMALLSDAALRRALTRLSQVFSTISADRLAAESRTLWADSDEEDMRPMDGSGLSAPSGDETGRKGTTALARFSTDMTAQAESGEMDRIVGRDEEIRQIVDVLLRRRQNNPILTGEAGVGKTAVVEGFAQALARGDVPPKLKGIRLHALDIGAMQAGASMKGEFEQRLKSVIDEVQNSPVPIILFIDEAHTLIGAGGAAGTGDAANLMKPALARGTLRTIAATTFAEYRTHFEKDPALTRRFQPVNVEEPDVARCAYMLRGSLDAMEAHHGVRISDEAIVAAVTLSARYIPSRQLPDKAVSLLDTACARVAVSQSTTPARIADLRETIAALETEIAGKDAQRDLGEENEERIGKARAEKAEAEAELAKYEALYADEKAIVDRILELRQAAGEDAETAQAEVDSNMAKLAAANPDDRMVYAHVDAQAVASVISDWTGIPAGRMVTDELQAILHLSDHLRERVIGQDHGLRAIAKRIEASRAGLSNPEKPVGVFMLAGPSGVGKTETALALAEQLYGGEQNVITIAMSEFQEAHTVSLLKGAPPGYVGYGEGGRLTEAVRRKPYSVVLLDEIEKAHPDVHELFFQVFDKGRMEDGNGRMIDFRNTLILLTSNVGTDLIMDATDQGREEVEVDELAEAIKPDLLKVFPPALLGRIVTIPYLPLGPEVLAGIAALKLKSVARRLDGAHGATLTWDQALIDHVVAECRDPDSGGRMIDNIITNSILPDLSRRILGKMVAGEKLREVGITMKDGIIAYTFDGEAA